MSHSTRAKLRECIEAYGGPKATAGLHELEAENARLRAILSEVAAAGVSFEDPRVGYVEVQIDRATWAAVQVQEHPSQSTSHNVEEGRIDG